MSLRERAEQEASPEVAAAVYEDVLDDLRERLVKAEQEVQGLRPRAYYPAEEKRLRGKAEGLRLALSYLDEMRRG